MSASSRRNKRRRQEEAEVKGPKMIRADKAICGDKIKVSESFLEIIDVFNSGETVILTLKLHRGGFVERTYGLSEPVEIKE